MKPKKKTQELGLPSAASCRDGSEFFCFYSYLSLSLYFSLNTVLLLDNCSSYNVRINYNCSNVYIFNCS